MRIQRGHIWRVEKSWFGRWYQDEIEDGKVVRRQRSARLCEFSDRYRSESDVQPLLDAKLQPMNEGRSAPEGTLSIDQYFEQAFMPYAESELKPSTANGYRQLWKTYLKPHATIRLRDFRCKDATDILAAIHREHKLSRKSIRHCKGLLSTIFTHARGSGAIDTPNPVIGTRIPKAAKKAPPTHAYSVQEIFAMLDMLTGVARTAIALMYFCGLRPGEARAARWENYDSKTKTLLIRASMWRTILLDPKTAESVAPVPVADILCEILAETQQETGFILAGPSGKSTDLHNLARRVVVPSLNRCAICHEREVDHAKASHTFELDETVPRWRGWYACRRGLATAATSVESPLAAKSLLRHTNIQTTAAHYIKSVPEEAVRAMDKINALFDNRSRSDRPN